MKYSAVFFLVICLVILSPPARAGVVAKIDLSSQTMRVYVNGSHRYSWAVSTGRGRYRTPTGSFRPTFLKRRHYSSRYNGSPMPYSVFFHRGYAIHGTYHTKYLGRRASHGCVRLHPSNAARLYGLIRRYGSGNTRIVIRY
jgi:lipoprotein-anchoring transpeptidase ErfK/SrfK